MQVAATDIAEHNYGVDPTLLIALLSWSHNENLMITVIDAWHINTSSIEKAKRNDMLLYRRIAHVNV